MMNDVAKTPREELECEKKYLYEYSMFWECNDGSKCQILEEDVCEKLNEQQEHITHLEDTNDNFRIKLIEDIEAMEQAEKKIGEQQSTIEKQNELIKLIANACTYSKEHSVKEILRKEIKGIDTVTYESAGAWHDYVILSEFFKEHYKEHWDNE